MFDYKQRVLTREYEEGWDRVFGKKTIISNDTTTEPCNNQTTAIPLTQEDIKEIKRLTKEGVTVFYE